MPFINVKTTASADNAKCEAVKSALGKAIALIPGKSEQWLMVGIETGCKLWFAGDASADSAYVTVAVLGKLSAGDSEKVTSEITRILGKELSIAPDRVYISYSEHDKWGWNGSNF